MAVKGAEAIPSPPALDNQLTLCYVRRTTTE